MQHGHLLPTPATVTSPPWRPQPHTVSWNQPFLPSLVSISLDFPTVMDLWGHDRPQTVSWNLPLLPSLVSVRSPVTVKIKVTITPVSHGAAQVTSQHPVVRTPPHLPLIPYPCFLSTRDPSHNPRILDFLCPWLWNKYTSFKLLGSGILF